MTWSATSPSGRSTTNRLLPESVTRRRRSKHRAAARASDRLAWQPSRSSRDWPLPAENRSDRLDACPRLASLTPAAIRERWIAARAR